MEDYLEFIDVITLGIVFVVIIAPVLMWGFC